MVQVPIQIFLFLFNVPVGLRGAEILVNGLQALVQLLQENAVPLEERASQGPGGRFDSFF